MLGVRVPSFRKRVSSKFSVNRVISKILRLPRGSNWITHPKKALYNKIYHGVSKSSFKIYHSPHHKKGERILIKAHYSTVRGRRVFIREYYRNI